MLYYFVSLSRLMKFFLNPNNYRKVGKSDDGSLECFLNKNFCTRPGMVGEYTGGNIIFNDAKYKKVSFEVREEKDKIKFPFLGQMIVSVMACLNLILGSSKANIVTEIANIFELFLGVLSSKSLTLNKVISVNNNKRKKYGGFMECVYLKFMDVPADSEILQKYKESDIKTLANRFKRINFQKMVRDKIAWQCEYIITEENSFIHNLYSTCPSEVLPGNLVQIHINKKNDGSIVYLSQVGNVNSCVLIMLRKLIEETKEAMNAKGSNFVEELSDMFEVIVSLLDILDIKMSDVLKELSDLNKKFGKIDVSVKKVKFWE
jgi:phosphoribosyl-ATP pyrophosphohydrolase